MVVLPVRPVGSAELVESVESVEYWNVSGAVGCSTRNPLPFEPEDELKECEVIELTSDKEWDPSKQNDPEMTLDEYKKIQVEDIPLLKVKEKGETNFKHKKGYYKYYPKERIKTGSVRLLHPASEGEVLILKL